MKHEVIEKSAGSRLRPALWKRPSLRRAARPIDRHSAAATRFAEVCAGVGGTTMLHDLMPDVVTVSFGPQTAEVCKRLHARGWTFVGSGEWQGERVLGVSFAGDPRARATANELTDALIAVVGELEVAETRIW